MCQEEYNKKYITIRAQRALIWTVDFTSFRPYFDCLFAGIRVSAELVEMYAAEVKELTEQHHRP
jgi:hypothetical protein